MKPMPPWICTPCEATSTPMSVDQALAIGVSSSSRSLAALRSSSAAACGQVGGDAGRQADAARGLDLGLHQGQGAADVRVVEERGIELSPVQAERPWRRSSEKASACW
jgi:hypothetical protein